MLSLRSLTSLFTRRAAVPAQGAESRALTGSVGTFLAGPVMSGVAVSPETALTFTAVFSAINTIATDVASLPFEVCLHKEPVPLDPRYDLVYCEPNEDTTSIRFRTAQMGHVLSWGNSYSEIERLGNGTPAALHLLSPKPNDTRPDRTRNGKLWYMTEGGRGPTLPAEDVLHIAGLGHNGIVGFSPIAFARQAIGLGIAAELYGAGFFGNGSSPKGVLTNPGTMLPENLERLREQFERVHQGVGNAHRIAILEEGMKWESTSIPPDQAQFLATRQFQVLEVARIYNLPPWKLGDFSEAGVRANVEESNQDYLDTTLRPWLVGIEQEYGRKLFTLAERRRGLCVRHNMRELLRGNTTARTARNSAMSQRGALSADDWRADEGFPPIGPEKGGDLYLVQRQNVPLEAVDDFAQLDKQAAAGKVAPAVNGRMHEPQP